ncbi:hypothetical protein B0H63DRAFT_556148 [Podospora didyma]|uniref:F-box domain-containing protein n=1 Tax=Podospora didyma TaxID=330526 RepID=A0AAE0U8L6_9PEZI|nr:hypothetical protein B0H63DRAFT_556148 [Podospora didyma]
MDQLTTTLHEDPGEIMERLTRFKRNRLRENEVFEPGSAAAGGFGNGFSQDVDSGSSKVPTSPRLALLAAEIKLGIMQYLDKRSLACLARTSKAFAFISWELFERDLKDGENIAFEFACRREDLKLAQRCLDHGMSLSMPPDDMAQSPVMKVINNGMSPAILNMLILNGAAVEKVDIMRPFDFYYLRGSRSMRCRGGPRPPVSLDDVKRVTRVVRLLVEAGACANNSFAEGHPSLRYRSCGPSLCYLAAQILRHYPDQADLLALIDFLLDRGLKPKIRSYQRLMVERIIGGPYRSLAEVVVRHASRGQLDFCLRELMRLSAVENDGLKVDQYLRAAELVLQHGANPNARHYTRPKSLLDIAHDIWFRLEKDCGKRFADLLLAYGAISATTSSDSQEGSETRGKKRKREEEDEGPGPLRMVKGG